MNKIILDKKKIYHQMIDAGLTWRDLAKKMNCSESGNVRRHGEGWPIVTAGRKLIEVLEGCDLSNCEEKEIRERLAVYE